MGARASNVSFNGDPVELELTSPYIVLIDPLALDGLRDRLQELSTLAPPEQPRLLQELSQPLRIGLHEVRDFRPGTFQIGLGGFERADDSTDPRTVDIDSGTVVLADLAHLPQVARVLTWSRYDTALQSPPGDDTVFAAIQAEIGGRYFALLSASVDTPFDGDGAFRLRDNAPTRAQ